MKAHTGAVFVRIVHAMPHSCCHQNLGLFADMHAHRKQQASRRLYMRSEKVPGARTRSER
jgi:hypothetical protein